MSENTLSAVTRPNRITAEDIEHHLDMAVLTKIPCLIWGAAGVGKTQMIEEYTKKKGYHFIDFLLAIRDSVDVHGVPDTIKEDGTTRTKWAIPQEIPLEGDSKYDDDIIIFFLDELTTATPETQAAALKMVNEHKIDDVKLHPNVRFVGAANHKGTRSHYNELLPPLKNRFKHYHMQAVKKPWVAWAIENNLHLSVIGFLGQGGSSEEDFHIDNAGDSNYKKALEGNAFQTGRTWEFLSLSIVQLENMYGKGTDTFKKYLKQEVFGTVGLSAGAKFLEFYNLAMEMPTPEEICEGRVKDNVFKGNTGQQFYISTALSLHIKKMYDKLVEDVDVIAPKKDHAYVDSLNNAVVYLEALDAEMLTTFLCGLFKVYKVEFDFTLNIVITKAISNNEELKLYVQAMDK